MPTGICCLYTFILIKKTQWQVKHQSCSSARFTAGVKYSLIDKARKSSHCLDGIQYGLGIVLDKWFLPLPVSFGKQKDVFAGSLGNLCLRAGTALQKVGAGEEVPCRCLGVTRCHHCKRAGAALQPQKQGVQPGEIWGFRVLAGRCLSSFAFGKCIARFDGHSISKVIKRFTKKAVFNSMLCLFFTYCGWHKA